MGQTLDFSVTFKLENAITDLKINVSSETNTMPSYQVTNRQTHTQIHKLIHTGRADHCIVGTKANGGGSYVYAKAMGWNCLRY